MSCPRSHKKSLAKPKADSTFPRSQFSALVCLLLRGLLDNMGNELYAQLN